MTNVKKEPKEDMDEYGVDSTAFEALEKEFQELLDSMNKDGKSDKLKHEYEKLYRAFQTSFKNEKRLSKRCKELNEIIIAHAANVRASILAQDDSQLIASLRKEVHKAWSMVDVAKNKEAEMKKKVTELRAELGHLQSIVSQGAGLPVNQETTISGLMKDKEKLTKDNELLNEDLKKEKQMNSTYLLLRILFYLVAGSLLCGDFTRSVKYSVMFGTPLLVAMVSFLPQAIRGVKNAAMKLIKRCRQKHE